MRWRNLTQAGPQGTLTSTWDIGGRRTRITHPDGFYVDQDYLVTGELQKIRENGATSGVGVLATYAYDDLGRRTSVTRGDSSSTSYTYDNASRLTQLAEDVAGTSYDQTLGFSYNPAGQIVQNTRSNDTYAWTGHYNVNRNYTANGLNQYTASGSVTPTYDTKGNLTSAGSTTYGYSSENLLTSASGGITLAYDPAMRLYETAGGTAGTTRFQYDGTDLVAEYNSSNALQRRFVHGPGTDEPIVSYEGSGTTDRRFLHSDERGSVVSVTDSSGTVLSVNTYDEYGIPRSSNSGRFQYTGQTWLPELGLYYYKARIYSPTLGRFLQADPIGYDAGMNRYAYVHSDPVGARDPTGKCLESERKSGRDDCAESTIREWVAQHLDDASLPRETNVGDLVRDALRYFRGELTLGDLKANFEYRTLAAQGFGVAATREQIASCATPNPDYICGIFRDMSPSAVRTMRALFQNPAILRAFAVEAVKSGYYNSSSPNEWGMWLAQSGKGYVIVEEREGYLNHVDFYPRPPGADVFFHIHVYKNLIPGFSPQDLSLGAKNNVMITVWNVPLRKFFWEDYRGK